MSSLSKLNLLIITLVILVAVSCKKKEEEPSDPQCFENPQPNITLDCSGYCFDCEEEPFPTNDVYFKANIDGKWVMFQSGNTNGLEFHDILGVRYRVLSSGVFKNPDNPVQNFASIQLLGFGPKDEYVQDTTIYDAWIPDTYDPGNKANSLAGFVIKHTDEDGVTWTTENNNAAGTMNIVHRSALNQDYFTVRGAFTAKFWTQNGTSLINNVSGEFSTIVRTR